MEAVREGNVAYSEKFKGPIKPNIRFNGEEVSEEFFKAQEKVGENCDLLLVFGSDLSESPFNQTVYNVAKNVPKVLINTEDASKHGLPFDHQKLPERLFLKGNCDEILEKLAEDCDWDYQLDQRM